MFCKPPHQYGCGGTSEETMEYREKLVRTIAHALGSYMAARFMGEDAEVQLQRYKRLGKALEDYDNNENTSCHTT